MKLIHASAGPVTLVPVEPTDEMCIALCHAGLGVRGVHALTLAAAPTDPTDDLVALYEALRGLVEIYGCGVPDCKVCIPARAALARFRMEDGDAG